MSVSARAFASLSDANSANKDNANKKRADKVNTAMSASVSVELQGAIEQFSDLSSKLTASYQLLEDQVDTLKTELEVADQQRQEGETEKQRLKLQFERILDILPASVVMLDGNGVVINANQAAYMLLGEPLEGSLWISIIERCFQPNPVDGHEIALKNGRLVSLATQSLEGSNGQIIVLTDLTETRQLQRQLSHHQKLSEMGKMTASLAHQVRTPLSTALLYADHLTDESINVDNRVRFAGKLKGQLLHLQNQINDMLIFSKQGIVINDTLSISELSALMQRQYLAISEKEAIDIRFENAADSALQLDQCRLRCNQELLISALSNVVDNARQALREQSMNTKHDAVITVTFGLIGKGLLNITISDNGPGINPAIIDRITEPFFTTKSTGTGLGLAVVNAIVMAHGGQFAVANRPNHGVDVTVHLPLSGTAATTPAANVDNTNTVGVEEGE